LQAAEYTLMPSPQTVSIGNFNAASRPALTIESGDTVEPIAKLGWRGELLGSEG